MLVLAKVTGTAAGGYAEYLEGKTTAAELGDYYLKDGERVEAPGRWAQGAERFGLDPTAPVTGGQLRTLMAVARPDTGERLRAVGAGGGAVAAIDATFSAPKSVSAAWAIAGPTLRQQIEAAHEHAVDRALTYAIRQVPMLRRRVSASKVIHEKATGLVATGWRHTTARAVADQVPDPQLHSHVLLHAAVRRDGRLVAIDSRSWLVHQREVGAAYRTELAHELHHLGFGIQRGTGRGGRYFELDGIPQRLLDRWSSRHHQVQAAIRQRISRQERTLMERVSRGGPDGEQAAIELEQLRETGQLSPKQERLMGTLTRTAKLPTTTEDLDTNWRQTASTQRLDQAQLEQLRAPVTGPLSPARPEQVLEALTDFDATFAAREARAAALEQSAGTPIETALDQLLALRDSGEILLLADGTGTTRDHRAHEHAVVAITERLAARHLEPIPESTTARETERLDQELAENGGRLSDEQRAAIELACGEHPLVVIEGHAGTGKSTTLTGIARAHQATGRQIIVTSTAALAAERLANELQEHGVDCAAFSTAGLHAGVEHGRVELDQHTTVIHDEAALASTREQLQLMREIERSGARLIAVGDPQQNQPVGAGGLWNHIEHKAQDAGALVELTHNQRARHPADRKAQHLFRKGEIETAIRTYDQHDRIHLHHDQRQVEDQALEAAHHDRATGNHTIVIAQTSNEHLDELNARAQAIRKHHGELGHESIPVPGRPYELHAGDQVQVRHTIHHPEYGQLRNGTTATITDIDREAGELALELARGDELTLDQEQIGQADLRLAYVQHPFPAQGHTTDTAHVIIDSQATREGTYVALSRAREPTHLYAADFRAESRDDDRLKELAERVSHTEPEVPSITTPLAHEAAIATGTEQSRTLDTADSSLRQASDRRGSQPVNAHEPSVAGRGADADTSYSQLIERSPNVCEVAPGAPNRSDRTDVPEPQRQNAPAQRRVWPSRDLEPLAPEHEADRLEHFSSPEREL